MEILCFLNENWKGVFDSSAGGGLHGYISAPGPTGAFSWGGPLMGNWPGAVDGRELVIWVSDTSPAFPFVIATPSGVLAPDTPNSVITHWGYPPLCPPLLSSLWGGSSSMISCNLLFLVDTLSTPHGGGEWGALLPRGACTMYWLQLTYKGGSMQLCSFSSHCSLGSSSWIFLCRSATTCSCSVCNINGNCW